MRSLLAVAALLAASAARAANQLGSYSFSPTAVEGSARMVGMGGALLANPKDYSAVFVNPAGLGGLSGDGVDFGSDSNNIDNFFIDPNDPTNKDLNDPLNFQFEGMRFVSSDGWGFGFAAQSPYQLDDQFVGTSKVSNKARIAGHTVTTVTTGQDQSEIKAKSTVYTIAAAKTFLDKRLSVGVAANYIQVSESYSFTPVFSTTAPVHNSVTNDGFSADIGVIGKPYHWLALALVYKMGYDIPIDPSRNATNMGTFGPVAAFRDGKSPDRVSVGMGLIPNRYFDLMLQSNVVFPMSDAVVVGSGLFPGSNANLPVGRRTTVDAHWGAEVVPIDEPDLTIKFWAGGYLEDTGLSVGFRRYHRTAGFAFQPWFLGLSMAIDDTNLYDNFTVGLGVDLLEVSQRVAKKYGWNLPL